MRIVVPLLGVFDQEKASRYYKGNSLFFTHSSESHSADTGWGRGTGWVAQSASPGFFQSGNQRAWPQDLPGGG